MAQEETRKKKTGMARCLELASQHKGLVFISGILAAAAAVCSFLWPLQKRPTVTNL